MEWLFYCAGGHFLVIGALQVYIVLYRIVLYRIVLYRIVLYCINLQIDETDIQPLVWLEMEISQICLQLWVVKKTLRGCLMNDVTFLLPFSFTSVYIIHESPCLSDHSRSFYFLFFSATCHRFASCIILPKLSKIDNFKLSIVDIVNLAIIVNQLTWLIAGW